VPLSYVSPREDEDGLSPMISIMHHVIYGCQVEVTACSSR